MTTEMEQNGERAKVRMTTAYEACVDELIGAALALDSGDVDEYAVLARIMVKAGAAWRCTSCEGINVQRNVKCDNCNCKRPRQRSIPVKESRFWEKGE